MAFRLALAVLFGLAASSHAEDLVIGVSLVQVRIETLTKKVRIPDEDATREWEAYFEDDAKDEALDIDAPAVDDHDVPERISAVMPDPETRLSASTSASRPWEAASQQTGEDGSEVLFDEEQLGAKVNRWVEQMKVAFAGLVDDTNATSAKAYDEARFTAHSVSSSLEEVTRSAKAMTRTLGVGKEFDEWLLDFGGRVNEKLEHAQGSFDANREEMDRVLTKLTREFNKKSAKVGFGYANAASLVHGLGNRKARSNQERVENDTMGSGSGNETLRDMALMQAYSSDAGYLVHTLLTSPTIDARRARAAILRLDYDADGLGTAILEANATAHAAITRLLRNWNRSFSSLSDAIDGVIGQASQMPTAMKARMRESFAGLNTFGADKLAPLAKEGNRRVSARAHAAFVKLPVMHDVTKELLAALPAESSAFGQWYGLTTVLLSLGLSFTSLSS